MKENDVLISTGIDKFIRLVNQSEKIEIEEASKKMGVPLSQIENWVQILEDEGIVMVINKFTKRYIQILKLTPEEYIDESTKIKVKSSELRNDITEFHEKLEKDGKELLEVYKIVKNLEKNVNDKFKSFESKADILKKTSVVLDNFENKIIGSNLSSIESKMNDLNLKLENAKTELKKEILDFKVDTINVDSEKIKKQVDDLKNKLENVDLDLEKLEKKIDFEEKRIKEITEIDEQINSILNKVKSLSVRISSSQEYEQKIEKKLQDTDEKLKSINEKINSLNEFLDKLYKFKNEIEQKSKLKKISLVLSKHIDKKIEEIKIEIKDTTKNKNELEKIKDEISSFWNKEFKDINQVNSNLKQNTEDILYKQDEIKESVNLIGEELQRLYLAKDEIKQNKKEIIKKIEEFKLLLLGEKQEQKKSHEKLKDFETKKNIIESEFENLEKTFILIKQDYGLEKKKLIDQVEIYSKSGISKKELEEILSVFNELNNKKNQIEKIRQDLHKLLKQKENISKQLVLLSKEAEILIDVRLDKGFVEKEKELTEKFEVVKNDADDFDKNREILKDLIVKLWEDEK